MWSISRGLARSLEDRGEFKRMMDHADRPQCRGDLSEAALKEFCEWFLTGALDQIRFSKATFDLDRLEDRYRFLVKDISDDKRAPDLLAAVLKHGSLERGDVHLVLKTSERTARNTMSALVR
ncbi:hypothetical protein [Mesorhizobium waimense]|uniref:hypothetical protein n=1 Tax=Mesorhizobium waimense TaxID=1300307 RepID=UPI001ABF3877|nr:hypothetical protein [Mesorhizobium waimense]